MKKLLVSALGLLLTMPAWADLNLEPVLNKVSLQLHAEQWVTTKTALVNVAINAAVTDQGIEKLQNEVLQKLSQLANKGDWHIVSLNRQQDKSGLETVQIMAQARLAQEDLSNLREKAKTISKPGVTFTIDNVQFTPSEEEIRQANTTLRNNIYQQANLEIDALNKMYPTQKYYLYQVNFMNDMPAPMPMMAGMAKMNMAAAPAAPLSIGDKVELQAMVVLASLPDSILQKLAHN